MIWTSPRLKIGRLIDGLQVVLAVIGLEGDVHRLGQMLERGGDADLARVDLKPHVAQFAGPRAVTTPDLSAVVDTATPIGASRAPDRRRWWASPMVGPGGRPSRLVLNPCSIRVSTCLARSRLIAVLDSVLPDAILSDPLVDQDRHPGRSRHDLVVVARRLADHVDHGDRRARRGPGRRGFPGGCGTRPHARSRARRGCRPAPRRGSASSPPRRSPARSSRSGGAIRLCTRPLPHRTIWSRPSRQIGSRG